MPTEDGPPDHDCEEVVDEVHSSRPDLTDTPSQIQSLNSTDRSSFVQDGQLKARFTVTTANNIIQAEALPQGRSTQ
jgi:hypothetical protein